MNNDVVVGRTLDEDGQIIPLELSQDARDRGYSLLFRSPEHAFADVRFSMYLRGVVFQGKSLFEFFQPPLTAGGILFVVLLPIAALVSSALSSRCPRCSSTMRCTTSSSGTSSSSALTSNKTKKGRECRAPFFFRSS